MQLKQFVVILVDNFSRYLFRRHTELSSIHINSIIESLHVEQKRDSLLLALTRPCLGDSEMIQVICDALVFRKIGEFGLLDLEPVLGSALSGVAVLLLRSHVRPADPVLVLGLALQVVQHIAFHLPCDLSWTPILSDPLLPGDAFPQQGQGEEHDGTLYLTL